MSFSSPKLRSSNRSKSRSSLGTSTSSNPNLESTPQSQSYYKPTTPSSLANIQPHRNAIPYHLLSSSPANSSPSQTPLNPSNPFNPASNYNNFNSGSSSPVFRRNAPFGSPGNVSKSSPRTLGAGGLNQRFRQESVGMGNGDSSDSTSPKVKRSRFIRKRPFKERIISLPSELYHSLSLRLSLYLSDLLYVPNNAYILSIFLHSLSLISCILSPDVSFGFGLPSFASSSSTSGKPKAMFGGGSGIDGLRGIAKDQMDVGWRGISFLVAFLALGLSFYTTYLVSTTTKSYSLWMRGADHKMSASSSRLIDVPLLSEEEPAESLQDQLVSLVLKGLKSLGRKIPVVNWFIPSDPASRPNSDQDGNPKMISIQVWDPNEVLLRTCCLYSPLHSSVYLLLLSPLPTSSGLSPAPNTPLGWVLLLSLMALGSAQTFVMCLWFKEREKDKATLAGEVMFEYEQKFVIPRALPAVRDASTMTSQAEFINPKDWQTTPSHSRAKGRTTQNRHDSSFEDRSYLGRRGGRVVNHQDEGEEEE